jgi:hypothetical protein
MFCDEWQECGHHERDRCRPFHLWVSVAGTEQRYEAFYFGSGEWDSRDAMLALDAEAGWPPGVQPHNLAYLSGMSTTEAKLLAQAAFVNLMTEWWCGIGCDKSCDHDEVHPSHNAVDEFIERCRRQEWVLSEGMVRDFGDDLAGELRIFRGWCIHKPWDKHEVDLNNPMMFTPEQIEHLLRR